MLRITTEQRYQLSSGNLNIDAGVTYAANFVCPIARPHHFIQVRRLDTNGVCRVIPFCPMQTFLSGSDWTITLFFFNSASVANYTGTLALELCLQSPAEGFRHIGNHFYPG